MKNVAVAPCKKASEQWVMCRDFFRILTRTLKTEQPARSDTRIEQAFSVSFLEIRPGNTRTRYRNGYGVRTGASLLKFSKEMEKEIEEYRKQFTQEDTMAGTIQGWLDAYKGTHVCSVQIWKEAFDHFDREPKKFETNEICSIMDTQITGWKRAGIHRFEMQGYGRQRSWIREGTEDEDVNEPDKDGFTKLTKAEQPELPFDLPDREKG